MASHTEIDWATIDPETVKKLIACMEANPQLPLDANEILQTNDDSMSGITNYSAMLADAVAANGMVNREPLQMVNEDR
jgi:hypothetical protein